MSRVADRRSTGEADLVVATSAADQESRLDGQDTVWPPFRGAALPPRLRDLLTASHGEGVIPLYSHLMGVVEAFAPQPSGFRAATDTALMLDRVRSAALRLEAAEVRASIIVPVFDNLVYTLTCIASVLEHGARVPFEIIVGDDRSSDDTFAVLSSLGGCVRVVRHETNLGFLPNCNRTARFARGDIVVMLNNDTLVLPGWLDAMVGTFEAHPAAGLVGSKLINGDGTLQEAGGIVWRNASGWNFGRNADPSWPEYNYLKEADYLSGASVAVPRPLWDELGGFDPIYAPGYCEDSDFAFRIREAGYTALYQPASSLIHHEGRSHGRDVTAGVKAYQRINRETFRERWQARLDVDHFVRGESVFVARDRSRWKPHLLFIGPGIPCLDHDARSRAMIHRLAFFQGRGFQVTLWPDGMKEDREAARRLQGLGIEVFDAQHGIDRFSQWLERRRDWIDYAFVTGLRDPQPYLDTLAQARTRVIYDGDVGCPFRGQDGTGDPAVVDRAKTAWSKSHVILASCREQADATRRLVDAGRCVVTFPTDIVSNAALDALAARLEGPDRSDPCALVFAAGVARQADGEAMAWFARTVMPLVRQQNPAVHLRVAGAPEVVAGLAGDGIAVVGRVGVDGLRELYASSAVAVVPLRHGAEVEGTLIEAFAHGTPVVSTSAGVHGIPAARTLALVADEPAAFARHILLAIGDREAALGRARRAMAFLRRHYSEDSAVAALAPHLPHLREPPSPDRPH